MSLASTLERKIIYVDCNESDTTDGVALESIVGMALQRMGTGSIGSSAGFVEAEAEYNHYCTMFQKKLGQGEPFVKYVKLTNRSREGVVTSMKNILPHLTKEFDDIINDATAKVTETSDQKVDQNSESVPENDSVLKPPEETLTVESGHTQANSMTNKLKSTKTPDNSNNSNLPILAQYFTLKILRSGQNIEIIPCKLQLIATKEQGRLARKFNWSNAEISIAYEERKFILNVFQIQAIIKKCKEEPSNNINVLQVTK